VKRKRGGLRDPKLVKREGQEPLTQGKNRRLEKRGKDESPKELKKRIHRQQRGKGQNI